MQMKMASKVLEIWLFGFGKVLKSFLKELYDPGHKECLGAGICGKTLLRKLSCS